MDIEPIGTAKLTTNAKELANKMVVGFSFSAMLSLGALMSRAVYSSRELSLRDPELCS
ncbi:hypothetical protein [Serratia ficaria]|jgi:hypothetical protein|uniref:hypothetical protein n=1 Tax=Serratia ficaria TaxID=61651 RepID=UPI0021B7BD8B|nr:hypothetical protein [Serratia ficaria]